MSNRYKFVVTTAEPKPPPAMPKPKSRVNVRDAARSKARRKIEDLKAERFEESYSLDGNL